MHNLIYIALGLFVLAAAFGLILFVQLLSERTTSKSVVILHGLSALLGLSALGIYLSHHPSNLWIGAIVLCLAALGGLTLLSFDLRQKAPPKVLLFMHPLAAMLGVSLLLAYFFLH